MIQRFTRWLPVMLGVGGFMLLGAPRDAHAVLQVRISAVVRSGSFAGPIVGTLDASATDQMAGDADPTAGVVELLTAIPPVTVGGVKVTTGIHISQQDFGPALAELLSSTASLLENQSGADRYVSVAVSGAGFTAAPPDIVGTTTAAGSFANAPGSFAINYYDNPADGLHTFNAVTGAFGNLGTLVTNYSTGLLTPVGIDQAAYQNAQNGLAVGPLSTFALAMTFDTFLAASSTLTGRTNTIQVASTVVPEPGTIAMALGALPLFGLYWARRRKTQA